MIQIPDFEYVEEKGYNTNQTNQIFFIAANFTFTFFLSLFSASDNVQVETVGQKYSHASSKPNGASTRYYYYEKRQQEEDHPSDGILNLLRWKQVTTTKSKQFVTYNNISIQNLRCTLLDMQILISWWVTERISSIKLFTFLFFIWPALVSVLTICSCTALQQNSAWHEAKAIMSAVPS